MKRGTHTLINVRRVSLGAITIDEVVTGWLLGGDNRKRMGEQNLYSDTRRNVSHLVVVYL